MSRNAPSTCMFVGVRPDDTAGEGIGPSALWEEEGGRNFFLFFLSDGPQVFAISTETLSLLVMTYAPTRSFGRQSFLFYPFLFKKKKNLGIIYHQLTKQSAV